MPATRMQLAYEQLRQKLLSGELPPGTRLVNRKLGNELGLSTVTVREAIHRLTSDGLVEHVPNAGAYVRELDRRQLRQLYEFREVLELFALGEVAKRINGDHLNALDTICHDWLVMAYEIRNLPDKVARGSLLAQWLANDIKFHQTLFDAADNPWLAKTVQDLELMSHVFESKPRALSLREAAVTWRRHVAIVRGLRRGDLEEAKHWMRVHTRSGLEFCLRDSPS